jgi:hypothetical protein
MSHYVKLRRHSENSLFRSPNVVCVPATSAQQKDYRAAWNMFTLALDPENYQTPIFHYGVLTLLRQSA